MGWAEPPLWEEFLPPPDDCCPAELEEGGGAEGAD